MNSNLPTTRRSIIRPKILIGFIAVCLLNGCASLRDSLILGAGTGVVIGGVTGSQFSGDRGENAIKGAVIGGVVGGLASYILHQSLESRDARVRRATLMNLEHYDVLGTDGLPTSDGNNSTPIGGKCYTTKEVDGRIMSIPCRLVNDGDESGEGK